MSSGAPHAHAGPDHGAIRDGSCLSLILAAWSCKTAFGLWLVNNCESAAAWHYLCADVSPWWGFLRSARAGFVPYVDFWREYPAGIGTLFWALGTLFGTKGITATLYLQAGLALTFDLVGAGLLYYVARPSSRRAAVAIAVASLLLPTALLLSPVRFESVVGAVVLLGFIAHRRDRWLWAAGIWSFGMTLKWYPVIAIAIAELQVIDRAYFRDRLPRIVAVCVAVQVLVNGPYLIAGLVEYGKIDNWLVTYSFHMQRRLSPDTVLGVVSLWTGPLAAERWATWFSAGLAACVLLTRRAMPLALKFTLVCIALLLVNRVYSPQFNLWFQPFVLLTIVSQSGARRAVLVALLAVIELSTIAIFPFLYASVIHELGGGFEWGSMAGHGTVSSQMFTGAIFLRAFALLGVMAVLYRIDLNQYGKPGTPSVIE